MALKEQDIVFTTTDEAGNTVIQMPITRVENVEDAVRTVNSVKPDKNGDVKIDIDMSHLATKEEVAQGLSKKREHTIQIANADLNTLLEDKTWACSGTLRNTPITCTFCIVQAYDTGAPVSGNIVQVCYVPNQTDNTVRTFWRNCDNGVTFGKWSESGALKTVNSIAPDTSGNVEIPAATPETYGLVRAATDATVIDEDADDAAITPAVYHDVSDFRHKNTAYALGDKVECMFNFELFLECTKAGTTSSTPLNTRTVKHGQVITDGTAEWTVRTHIRSINNAVADASGNITPEQTGCLPLNGGTMVGDILFESGLIYSNNNADMSEICMTAQTVAHDAHYDYTGAILSLRRADDKQIPGCFLLGARNGEKQERSLVGKPDGELSWDGRIVEQVAGINWSWIRYQSGLQICWGHAVCPKGVWSVTVTLPIAFVDSNFCIVASYTDGFTNGQTVVGASASSSTTFQICIRNAVNNDINFERVAGYIAIGTWK